MAQNAPSSEGAAALPRPPNFKQEKRRREEAQKKRNQEKQQKKAPRKDGEGDSQGGPPSETKLP